MYIRDDVAAAFKEAIAEGRLSVSDHGYPRIEEEGAPEPKDALDYMYMYTSDDGVDQFKHIDTRRYLETE